MSVTAISGSKRWLQTALLAIVVAAIIASYSNHWLADSGSSSKGRRESLPDFAYQQANGKLWRLSDHRGQIVLLNFWATWCPPCREETPGLVQLDREFRSKGLAIAGIAMDEDRSAILPFLKQFGISYSVLLPPNNAGLTNSVESLPTTLLLDRGGRVARSYVGAISESIFSKDIQQLLNEYTTFKTSQG